MRLVASLIPKEPEATTPQLWNARLTRSSMPLSRDVLKAVLILQATDEGAQIISSAFSTLLVFRNGRNRPERPGIRSIQHD